MSGMAKDNVVLLACLLLLSSTDAKSVTIGTILGSESSSTTAYSLSTGGISLERVIQDAGNVISSNYSFLTSRHAIFTAFERDNKDSLYGAMQLICDTIKDIRPTYLIVPEDVCPGCSDIASYISKATEGPIMSIDPGQTGTGSRAFKMYPTADDMIDFYMDVLKYYKWRKWTVIYDHGEMFNNFMPIRTWAYSQKFNVTYQSFEGNMDALAQTILSQDNVNIFLFTATEKASLDIIKGGLERGMLARKYHWIVGHLDVVIQRNLRERLKDQGVYLTRFMMNYTTEWQYSLPSFSDQQAILHEWPLQYRLAYDAVLTAGYGLMKYREDQLDHEPLNVYTSSVIQPCPSGLHYSKPNVKKLYNDTRYYNFEGLSGNIAFNENGDRVNYSLMVYSGRGRALDQLLGEWVENPKHWEQRFNMKWQSSGRFNTTRYEQGGRRTLKVVSIEVPPFLMMKNDPIYGPKRETQLLDDYKDYDRYQGFIVDLLEVIKTTAKGIDFDYDIELVPDGNFGRIGRYNRIWNGMIGEVYRGKADIAAGPLTIRPDRANDVQFTSAFMQADLAALIHHPSYTTGDVLSFLYPFSLWVWILNAAVFIIVSMIIYAINYFDPYEWSETSMRGGTFPENKDNFSKSNTMWFLASTLFFQSYDTSPRSNAGRVMAVFWWAFVIIMMFLYITHLPFFLQSTKRIASVRSMDEMLRKYDVQPGIVKSDSTFHLLKKSKDQTLNQFFKVITNAEPSAYVSSIEEGIERVRNSSNRFALIGETPVLDFHASKEPCDMYVTAGKIYRQSYALAVRKNSPLTEPLSHAIELLIKNEQIHRLELNWWHRHNRCGNLTTWEKQGIYSYTSVDFYGIYLLLALSMIVSFAVFLVESLCCCPVKQCKGKGSATPQRVEVRQSRGIYAVNTNRGENGVRNDAMVVREQENGPPLTKSGNLWKDEWI